MGTHRFTWWGYVLTVVKNYPHINQRELKAVQRASEQFPECVPIIERMYWTEGRRRTMQDVARELELTEAQARRLHKTFIAGVAFCGCLPGCDMTAAQVRNKFR